MPHLATRTCGGVICVLAQPHCLDLGTRWVHHLDRLKAVQVAGAGAWHRRDRAFQVLVVALHRPLVQHRALGQSALRNHRRRRVEVDQVSRLDPHPWHAVAPKLGLIVNR